jgi:hypothetical protein
MKNLKNYSEFLNEHQLGYTNYDVDSTNYDKNERDLEDEQDDRDIEENSFPNDGSICSINGDITGDIDISINNNGEWESVKELPNFTLPEYSKLYYYGNDQFEVEKNSVIDKIIGDLQSNGSLPKRKSWESKKWSVYFYPDLSEWSKLMDEDKIEILDSEPSYKEDFKSDI